MKLRLGLPPGGSQPFMFRGKGPLFHWGGPVVAWCGVRVVNCKGDSESQSVVGVRVYFFLRSVLVLRD